MAMDNMEWKYFLGALIICCGQLIGLNWPFSFTLLKLLQIGLDSPPNNKKPVGQSTVYALRIFS